MELKFRDLRADEIDVRVGATTKDKNGNVTAFTFLLYKNARVDMALLDETLGTMNWQAKYYQVKSTMICSVGININYNDPSKEPYFIWKDNGGDDDFTTEQVKAECSDAFKRACFLIGIGRGLYSASKLYMRIERTEDNTEKSYYGCKTIEYDSNGNITKVVIYNKKTKKDVLVATLDKKVSQNGGNATNNGSVGANEPIGSVDKNDLKAIRDLIAALSAEQHNQFFVWLDTNYNTMSLENLTLSQGKKVLEKLNKRRQ